MESVFRWPEFLLEHVAVTQGVGEGLVDCGHKLPGWDAVMWRRPGRIASKGPLPEFD